MRVALATTKKSGGQHVSKESPDSQLKVSDLCGWEECEQATTKKQKKVNRPGKFVAELKAHC